MALRVHRIAALSALLLVGTSAYAQTTTNSGNKDWGWGADPDAVPIAKPIVPESTPASEPAPDADAAPTPEPPPAAAETKLPSPEKAIADEPPAPTPGMGDNTSVKDEMGAALRGAPAEDEGSNASDFELPADKAKPEPALEPKKVVAPALKEEVKPEQPKAAAKEEVKPAAAEQTTEEAKPEPAAAAKPAAASTSSTMDQFMGALVNTYKTNPRIKSERERQKATDEGMSQAISGFRPTATAGYNKGRQRTSFDNSDWAYGNTTEKTLSVSQPIFRGFGTISSVHGAKQRVEAGSYQLSAVEQQVMLQAISAYMSVVADASILDLARNNRDVLNKQLEASNERFNVGEVTRTDVAQSEARLSQAKTQVISGEGELIAAIAEFERVVGYKPEGQLEVPPSIPELPATLKEALDQAREANPQLLASIHSAKAAGYDVRTRESIILPQVSLVGAMSRQDGAGVLGSSKFDQDSVRLQVNVPLYQSGAEYSRVREAKNTARQRDQEAVDTRMAVDEAVTKAWEQLETAINTIRTRQDQIKAAEIALDGVKQEQEYGARTILDVLDAEQELFNASTNLVAAQRDRVVAAYNLLLNLGRLTPKELGLPVDQYDASEHYDDIKWLPLGF